MKDPFQFRLTGMVKARVMEFDGDLNVFIDTKKEVEVYLDDVANMRGVAAENDSGVYVVTERACKEFLDG